MNLNCRAAKAKRLGLCNNVMFGAMESRGGGDLNANLTIGIGMSTTHTYAERPGV